MAFVALACGGDDDAGGTTGSSNDDGNDSPASPANADLRMAGGDPITLDPAIAGDAGSATYIVEIFGGLVTLDRDLQIVPDLAESWEVSPDGLTYTFHIRPDAKFHDGKPVTANDFKYSLDRTARLGQSVSATAEAYLGDIVGAKDVTRGRADEISGVQVIDARTLEIKIDAPKAYFLAKLTYPTAFVVDQQQVEANPRNWTRKPNGTGPYKMAEWRLNERIILEANEDYHLGAPSVDRVLYVLAGGSTLTQYENDELDVAGISVNDIERVLSDRDPLNADYRSGDNLSVSYIGFNVTQPPFDDPNVRRAFAMAIDRRQIVRVVLKDMLDVANSFMMPGLPGYNQDATLPEFDPEGARAALAASKYKDAAGLGEVTLTEVGGGANAGIATQAIIEMWRTNLGVDVSIAQAEAASFYDDLDRGRLQMFDIGWIMDYPDPEDIIDLLFHSTSRQNNTHYSNPDFDAIVEEARTESDPTKRLQLYQDAEQILLEDLPWIPLYFGKDHFVVKPRIQGFDPLPIVIPMLRYLSIDE
ncbi:MAG TPA: peptide ABC transporter substrate-binding protein [Dehalococcoidia bacterium]|nr:peptide ABC transporter substrate-binding protein [Dehalococcoidia bacterium]